MHFSEIIKRSTTMIALVISITACSSKPDIKKFPESANAKQEITNLEVRINNSKLEETDLLAPVSFKEARNSLEEAKKMEHDDKKDAKILKEVALGHAYLDRARERAQVSRAETQDILVARNAAIKANANSLLPRNFSKLDRKVKEETAMIERDKESKIKERRSEFVIGYMDLELSAIKKHHLGESQFLIKQAIRNGARDLTPKTLSATNQKFHEAEQYITENRYNTPEIEMLAAGVLEEARNLDKTTATARGISASTPEQTALRMQAEEERLGRTEDALAVEQEKKMELEASNIEMNKSQMLNAVYEEARTKFSPDEAEVYKQGNNLVIRLKSLKFPTAQAVLRGDNFPLLKKVDEIIESFDKSKVIVEGHTDSTGSKQINQRLSDERADAVKQYLEANASEKATDFDSKGYGYEKPLATNKTPEGRAQNRRVDVIIAPREL